MATKKTTRPKAAHPDLTATVFGSDAKKAGSVTLPENMFGVAWSADLVHQVVTAMTANARKPWAHVRERGEVSGGGKKPWKQKGTGRARHGSSRSPIWRKGGVTHGPRNDKDYSQKVNKKMRTKALFTVLSKKYAEGQILFLSDLAMKEPKTAEARKTLTGLGGVTGFESLATRRNNAAYIILPVGDANVKKSFQNMGNVLVGTTNTLNPVDLLQYKYLVLVKPEDSVKLLEAKLN